jgi:hypothetical protein
MKVTVELSESELEEIQRFANEKRKGPAIRKLALDGLMIRKRKTLGEKIMKGSWSVELPDLKKLRKDRSL